MLDGEVDALAGLRHLQGRGDVLARVEPLARDLYARSLVADALNQARDDLEALSHQLVHHLQMAAAPTGPYWLLLRLDQLAIEPNGKDVFAGPMLAGLAEAAIAQTVSAEVLAVARLGVDEIEAPRLAL